MVVIRPLEWTETKANGRTTLKAASGCVSVYECADRTWRVYFEHGHDTEIRDNKIRCLPNRDQAIREANKWWQEWLLQWFEPSTVTGELVDSKPMARFKCETCQSEATIHVEAIGCHFCESCVAKIDARIRAPEDVNSRPDQRDDSIRQTPISEVAKTH